MIAPNKRSRLSLGVRSLPFSAYPAVFVVIPSSPTLSRACIIRSTRKRCIFVMGIGKIIEFDTIRYDIDKNDKSNRWLVCPISIFDTSKLFVLYDNSSKIRAWTQGVEGYTRSIRYIGSSIQGLGRTKRIRYDVSKFDIENTSKF